MKIALRMTMLFTLLLAFGGTFISCSSDSNPSVSGVPTGLQFTDENGNPITDAPAGTTVQVRNEDGDILFSFVVTENVDLSGLLAGKTDDVVFAHIPANSGITGLITLFAPCGAATNAIYVTPGAETAAQVSTDGSGDDVITLTIASPGATHGYTWTNADTREDDEDCEVTADASIFSTGAAGAQISEAAFSSNHFDEAGTNNGVVDDTVTVTLTGNTFAASSGELTENTDYILSGTALPVDLSLSVEVNSNTEVEIHVAGQVASHAEADSVEGITLAFLPAAFTDGLVPNDGSDLKQFAVNFDDPSIIMFSAGLHDGNLGGAIGANILCQTAAYANGFSVSPPTALKSSALGILPTQTAVAFISADPSLPLPPPFAGSYAPTGCFSANFAPGVTCYNQISDFPYHYSFFPSDQAIVSLDKTVIATDWSGLLDASIDSSLASAGVTSGATTEWWSGSTPGGTQTNNTCDHWNYPSISAAPSNYSVGFSGDYGMTNATDSTWIYQEAGSGDCTTQKHLICVVYGEPITF